MTEKPVRRFELCTERLKTVKDIKKVLKALQIRLDTDNSLYEELEYYFSTEVVPRGYIKVLEKVGYEGGGRGFRGRDPASGLLVPARPSP